MEANVRDEGAWFVCAVPARRAAGNQIGEVATEFADDSSGAAAWIETDKGDFGSVKLIRAASAVSSQPRFRHAPVSAASQHLNFSRQAGSDPGFRLRPFSFFLSTGTSARLSQLAQPDWNLLGFGRVGEGKPG